MGSEMCIRDSFYIPCLSFSIIHTQVVEDTFKYQEDTHSIYNTSAITMLLQWLSKLPPQLQQWLAMRLCDLCSHGPLNKQRCCAGGVLKSVVEVLTTSQEGGGSFSDDVEGTYCTCIGYTQMLWLVTTECVFSPHFVPSFNSRSPGQDCPGVGISLHQSC